MLLRCDSLEPPMHVLVGVKPERFELSWLPVRGCLTPSAAGSMRPSHHLRRT
jgi:hypothetical protein